MSANINYQTCEPEFYPGTNVFINKLSITQANLLREAESNATLIRAFQLLSNPYQLGKIRSISQLIEVHSILFSDLYSWAGKFRNYPVKKDLSVFTPPDFFSEAIEAIHQQIDLFLKPNSNTNKVLELAKLFRLLNKFHPFPEGNGRTQRVFVELFAYQNGWSISFEKVQPWEMIEVCKQAHHMNTEPLDWLFQRIVSPV